MEQIKGGPFPKRLDFQWEQRRVQLFSILTSPQKTSGNTLRHFRLQLLGIPTVTQHTEASDVAVTAVQDRPRQPGIDWLGMSGVTDPFSPVTNRTNKSLTGTLKHLSRLLN